MMSQIDEFVQEFRALFKAQLRAHLAGQALASIVEHEGGVSYDEPNRDAYVSNACTVATLYADMLLRTLERTTPEGEEYTAGTRPGAFYLTKFAHESLVARGWIPPGEKKAETVSVKVVHRGSIIVHEQFRMDSGSTVLRQLAEDLTVQVRLL